MRSLPLVAAATLSLALLAGCTAATPTPVPSPSETVAPYLEHDLTFAAGADYPTDVPVGFAIGLPSAGFAYQATKQYGVIYKDATSGCLALVTSGFAPADEAAKLADDAAGSLWVVDNWFPGIDNSTVSDADLIWVGGNKAQFKFADYIRPDNGNEQLYYARYVKSANIVLALMVDCGPTNPTRPKDVVDTVLAHIGVVPQVTTFPQ